MKRTICLVLAMSLMTVSSNSFCYASSDAEKMQIEAERQAEIIEEIVGTDQVTNDVSVQINEYNYVKDDISLSIPRDGNSKITIHSDEYEDINIGLPSEVSESQGVLATNGTIVYVAEEEDMAVSVQVLEEEEDNIVLSAVRTMLTIDNADAPNEYHFDFNLPTGYYLIKDTDYNDEYDEDDCGAVFIFNQNNEVVNVIDPAWAIDANGVNVQTTYSINGNILIQKVEFDENSAFPIIADPTSHPNKTKVYYLTKKQVLKVRDVYSGSTAAEICSYIVSLALLPAGYVIGAGWATITFMGNTYYTYKFNTWDKIYTNFKKNYAKISATWKWHSGKRTYRPTGKMSCTYVNSK